MFKVFGLENRVFSASPRKTMQIHYEITSEFQAWTRNVRTWNKSRDLDMSGPAKTSPGGQVLVSRAGLIFSQNYNCLKTFFYQ